MIRVSPQLVAGTFSLLLASPVLAQAPWSRVPVFPKSCYANDTFASEVEALSTELQAAIDKQKAINEELNTRLRDLDPDVQQARMMALLTKDPVAAQKALQEMSDPQHGAAVEVIARKRAALNQKLEMIQSEYDAETAPLRSLLGTVSGASNRGRTLGAARAAAVQYNALYQKLCVKWFASADSPYLPWLGELKRHLTDDFIPWHAESARRTKAQMDLMGIPSAAFKSTAELEAVKEYLKEATRIFNGRPAQPMVTG